jgi:Na+-transporting NADH:ubiquinone oxidoreductase subunit F
MLTTILSHIAIASGISAMLALILVIAERYLADYGDCKIDINGGKKQIVVKGGGNLLSALSAQKLFIPSACGGRGSCGFCKVKVQEGAGPLLPTEKPFLTPAELKDDIRLACQIKVKNDIYIHIPEELFAIRRFQTEVEEIVDYTYDIKGVTFRLKEPASIEFKAGQYVQLETRKYGKIKAVVSRAYSVSSMPELENRLQLIVRLVPDGICTTWVHQHLKICDPVTFTGPYGDFFIRDTDNDMIWIGGGSGMAPFKSMVEHLAQVKSDRRVTYFFGARTTRDLYLTDYLNDFSKQLPGFTYVPVLSQPEPDSGWTGRTGYVMPHFSEFLRDPKRTEAYLCGSPGMIAAATKTLKELGVPDNQIFFDSF